MDCSLPGSSVHEIFQARVLEWVAIAFSILLHRFLYLIILFLALLLPKAMATHSSTLAWKIPWMEEPGRLQSIGLLRVGHN